MMQNKILPTEIDFQKPFPVFNRKLRIGIVGGGRIAVTHATAARLTGKWDIVAGVLSSNPERAKEKAKEFFIDESRSYRSFQEMAEQEKKRKDGIDAVMITTPNHLHFEASAIFLKAGIDVLCDKPLTNQYSEAQALQELVKKTGLVFGVGYVMTCFPMIRQAKSIVESGKIGKINQIHTEFLQDWMIPENIESQPHVQWRLDPQKSGPTSCTGDIATHAYHLASFVSGLKITSLRAEMHVCGAPKELEDTVIMSTRYHHSVPGTLIATRLAAGNRGGLRLRIFGSKGGIEWDLEQSENLKLHIYGEEDRILKRGHSHGIDQSIEKLLYTSRGFPEGIIEAWGNLYNEFALAIAARLDKKTLPKDWLLYPKVSEGAEGVKFVEKALLSHQKGGAWVDL